MLQQLPLKNDFAWGAATSAYQIEGAADVDGKGPSNWDHFARIPGAIRNGHSGIIACDHYNRFRTDIALMRDLGLTAYRFSVSWPRVMPAGRGTPNIAGLDFYDALVDELRANDIEPFVTLFHWDLPLVLQSQLGGWVSEDLPQIFADYAEIMFKRLGDRVRYWMTLNEPWVVVDAGYFHGVHPPGIKDRALGYCAGHNLLRAHAYAVDRYRRGAYGDGAITFALNTSYSFPATQSPEDIAAAERAVLNFGGWFGDPAHTGDYPAVMRARLGDLLPEFTDADATLLRGSCDYIALNYYTSEVVRYAPDANPMEYEVVPQPNVPATSMNWPIRPDGFLAILRWLHERYGGKPIYITENGAALEDVPDETGFVDDQHRIQYLHDHLQAIVDATRQGVDVSGFFAWSLLDNLEWAEGFDKRFGLIRCDHATQTRTIKASGHWYRDTIKAGRPAPVPTARAV